MIRYCISTASPIKAIRKPNGEWTAEGLTREGFQSFHIEQIQMKQTISKPMNVTFFTTTEASECLDRLKNNLSDVTTTFIPIQSISPEYFVPQPLVAGKLQYVTGYNFTDKVQVARDTATVFTNADLLKPSVYIGASFLLACFVTFILVKVALFHRETERITKIPMGKMMRRQVAMVFHHSSERFRWITLLYSLLCFIMLAGFLCLYKTSHIIMDKPFYAKNYQESLDYPSSLAFYYDQIAIVSSDFKNAPPDSIRGKLWAKLNATGRQNDYSGSVTNLGSLPTMLKKAAEEMTVRRGICLASPLIIPVIKSLACGLSPEGELWVVKVLADPIEHEVIYGPALSKHFRLPPLLPKKMKTLFETHFLSRSYAIHFDMSALAARITGSSETHQWRQHAVCEDEKAFAPDPYVHGIPLSYYTSFFKANLVVWLFAFVLNTVQIFSLKMTKRVKRKKRAIKSLRVNS